MQGKPARAGDLSGVEEAPSAGLETPPRASWRPGEGSPSGSGELREPQAGSCGVLPVAASVDRRGRIAEAEV